MLPVFKNEAIKLFTRNIKPYEAAPMTMGIHSLIILVKFGSLKFTWVENLNL